MQPVKAALLLAMVIGLGAMWTHRDFVFDAYRIDEDGQAVRFEGVDLAVPRTDVGASPFSAAAAPDMRRNPVPVLDASTRADEPVEVEMAGGESELRGTVNGPEGPAFAGIVRIERHTSEGIGTVDVRVGADGRWSRKRLPGGRYRIRAWVPGQLTMTRSEVLFLDDEGISETDFIIGPVDPQPLIEFVEAGSMYNGLTGTVAVTLSQRVVDAEGRILIVPIPGATVDIRLGSEVTSLSGLAQVTDGQGAARFLLRCNTVGTGRLVARYGHLQRTFTLPSCLPIPKPTTTTTTTTAPPADDESGVAPNGTGSTTRPEGRNNTESDNG